MQEATPTVWLGNTHGLPGVSFRLHTVFTWTASDPSPVPLTQLLRNSASGSSVVFTAEMGILVICYTAENPFGIFFPL